MNGFYNAVQGQMASAETTIPARAAAVRDFYSNRFAKWGEWSEKRYVRRAAVKNGDKGETYADSIS